VHTFFAYLINAAFTLLSAYWTAGLYSTTDEIVRAYLIMRKHRDKAPDWLRLSSFGFSVMYGAVLLIIFSLGCWCVYEFCRAAFEWLGIGGLARTLVAISGFALLVLLMRRLRPKFDAVEVRIKVTITEHAKKLI
jgi:hypothetical protein